MRTLTMISLLLLTAPALAGDEDYELGPDSMRQGSPVVVVAGETVKRGPDDVFYIRSNDETDRILLDAAAEAGFNVIEG